MKVSYKWLDEYLDKKLPATAEAVNVLTMNSSEVENIENVGDDVALDIKILPNMAHSCLCHRGIAREFGALLNLPVKKYAREFPGPEFLRKVDIRKIKESDLLLKIRIENGDDCRRYVGRVIQNINIGPSPKWLSSKLECLGQKSINNLVDATNYVMLDIGQPMHVFDVDKIVGDTIVVKRARTGDEITTLDNKQVSLDEDVLVISNNNNALAIAGVKGGIMAEISPQTKNIFLESANFDPVLIRKTAQKLKIQTDASKRYENDLTPELASEAMNLLTNLIIDIAGNDQTKVGKKVDVYPKPAPKLDLGVSVIEVEKVLGIKIDEEDIINIYDRFAFESRKEGDQLIIKVPAERLDLRIKEDLIEEIGRVFGYANLVDNRKITTGEKGRINKAFYYSSKIKKLLVDNGFSEIYGYSFSKAGEIELANSVSPDKKFLRVDLRTNMKEYLEFNARYSELVSMPQIKIFEIGKVFKIGDEHTSLAIGVLTPVGTKGLPKDKSILAEAVNIIEKELNIKLEAGDENIAEYNFAKILQGLPEPVDYDLDMPAVDKNMRFKKISIYPFMLRDIAVFTPEGTKEEVVLSIINENAGALLVKYRLFDVFTKTFEDGTKKTSYAYHLVFQSYERTLSDEEANTIMDKITIKMNAKEGWEVR